MTTTNLSTPQCYKLKSLLKRAMKNYIWRVA